MLPDAAGHAIGPAQVGHARDDIVQASARALKVIAGPNAAGFYRRLGFRQIAEYPSLPNGRRLPILESNLAGIANVRS